LQTNSSGETRWWVKDKCLSKVFGPYTMPENALFVDLLETLQEISTSIKFNADVRYKASIFFEKFQTFEILITVHIFLRVFSCTIPLSPEYLQRIKFDNGLSDGTKNIEVFKRTVKRL